MLRCQQKYKIINLLILEEITEEQAFIENILTKKSKEKCFEL